MDWDTLARWLAALETPSMVDRLDPANTLRSLEARADRAPTDRALAAAVRALTDCVIAAEGRGAVVGGFRREDLLCWDGWTRTWRVTALETGGEAVLRELLPERNHPARRRALRRDAEALEGVVPGLVHGEGWLAAPLPGVPLPDQPTDAPQRLGRMLGTALVALGAFWDHGLWPTLAPLQVRLVDDAIHLVPLAASPPRDAGPQIAALAERLAPEGLHEGPIFDLLHALVHAPPVTVADAIDAMEQALATDLAARRHALFQRRRQTAHLDRMARLLELIDRLGAALPPPEGRGALGVDMDGRTLAVERRSAGLWWGPQGEMSPVWTHDSGFDAPEARRLLRVRARARPAPHLQKEVGGTDEATDALGRWIAAGLKARTVRLLLEKELDAET